MKLAQFHGRARSGPALGRRSSTSRLGRATRRTAAGAVVASLALGGLAAPSQAVYVNRPTQTWGVNGTVYAVASRGNITYLGGDFTSLVNPANGATRTANGIAAIDRRTGRPVGGFHASANGTVRSLAFSPGDTRLYVGGLFDHLDGAVARRLGVISPATGNRLKGFAASVAGRVFDLLVDGNNLYVAGKFTQVDATGRSGVAKLDATTGALYQNWNPRLGRGRPVALTMLPHHRGLVLGGRFASVDSVARRNVAAVRLDTGAPLAWDPHLLCTKACPVLDLSASRGSVFVAIAGPGGSLTALSAITAARRWTDHTDGDVQAVLFSAGDGRVYVGGHFNTHFTSVAGTVVRHQLAAVNPRNGATYRGFQPAMTRQFPGVWALAAGPHNLMVGGGFAGVRGQAQPRYAQFANG